MNPPRLLVAPADTWARLTAARIADYTAARLQSEPQRNVCLALSGGSTPRPVYSELAAMHSPMDWSRVELFLSDERMVPLDDADSNYRMIRENLTGRIAGRPPLLHPVPTELDVDAAALSYHELIAERVMAPDGDWPRFDLILLGIGTDGHTASLFPDEPELGVQDRAVAGTMHPRTGQRRTTFTLPLLQAAREVWFLASGASKSDIVARAIRGPASFSLPASVVAHSGARVSWILDQPAAAGVVSA